MSEPPRTPPAYGPVKETVLVTCLLHIGTYKYALNSMFLPRLQPRAELRGVSLEDQQNFVSVVTLLLVVFFVVVVLFVCLFIYLFFGCFNL